METSLLFVNKKDDKETQETEQTIKERARYSDTETLLKVIDALLENNKALKKYISLLENKLYL